MKSSARSRLEFTAIMKIVRDKSRDSIQARFSERLDRVEELLLDAQRKALKRKKLANVFFLSTYREV